MGNELEYLDFEQIPFGSESFADNPEPRCACLLLLDTSTSMHGKPIDALNEGLKTFKSELMGDALASKRVEVAVITFGPVTVQSEFKTVANFSFSPYKADGMTPLGEAVIKGVDLITKRKQIYKQQGIGYYRPWIILITDGAPTDSWNEAAALIKKGENDKSFAFFPIGVGNADFQILSQLSVRTPLKLDGLKFKEFFVWLSGSMRSVSAKDPGSSVNLLPTTGWSTL